jgi:hypothetical protein
MLGYGLSAPCWSLIFRADIDDTVRVNIERHLDLRHTASSRRNSNKVELAE